ncbi:MAG: transposase [Patescibacteria group bacterium]
MPNRKSPLENNELYHIYNRGIDKRVIFENEDDLKRFIQSMLEFNGQEIIGSLYENSFVKTKTTQLGSETPKLVTIINFCLNPNHFHFTLKQDSDRGIEKFMHRLGTGYTNYFNNKNHRSGSLFQGVFKSVHVNDNNYLLHLSAYINLNDRIHQLGSEAPKLESWSSWSEYLGGPLGGAQKEFGLICDTGVVLDQFKSQAEYRDFAKESLETSLEEKLEKKEREALWLE